LQELGEISVCLLLKEFVLIQLVSARLRNVVEVVKSSKREAEVCRLWWNDRLIETARYHAEEERLRESLCFELLFPGSDGLG
jgi:hypothetical protein